FATGQWVRTISREYDTDRWRLNCHRHKEAGQAARSGENHRHMNFSCQKIATHKPTPREQGFYSPNHAPTCSDGRDSQGWAAHPDTTHPDCRKIDVTILLPL